MILRGRLLKMNNMANLNLKIIIDNISHIFRPKRLSLKIIVGNVASFYHYFTTEILKIPKTFHGTADPSLTPENKVKDGDVWVYTGTPLIRYERVFGVWVSICSPSSVSSDFLFYGILDCGNATTEAIWRVDANENKYNIKDEIIIEF